MGPAERWRWIPGWEGLYEVSDLGRVRSHKRATPCVLKPGEWNGYLRVSLCRNGTRVNEYVHRLVAAAFVREPRDGEHVRHLNDVRTDNRACNIAVGSPHENAMDALGNGRNRVLSDDDVRSVRRLRARGLSQQRIADRFGVSRQLVSFIEHRKRWAHVPDTAA